MPILRRQMFTRCRLGWSSNEDCRVTFGCSKLDSQSTSNMVPNLVGVAKDACILRKGKKT